MSDLVHCTRWFLVAASGARGSGEAVAADLSALTGKKVRYHESLADDNPCQFGDFGWFIVEDAVPHVHGHVVASGYDPYLVPV